MGVEDGHNYSWTCPHLVSALVIADMMVPGGFLCSPRVSHAQQPHCMSQSPALLRSTACTGADWLGEVIGRETGNDESSGDFKIYVSQESHNAQE